MSLEFEQMIDKCIAKVLEIITGSNLKDKKLLQKQEKKYFKRQEIITKCLKQFDLRLFEGIGGNIQKNENEKNLGQKMKKTL